MANFNADKIKRILRNLKKEEIRMMRGILQIETVSFPLVWDQYFDLKEPYKGKTKYSLDALSKMSDVEFEQVINDYFNSILLLFQKKDSAALYPILNIPKSSDMETVKKRFRELAKITHPDTGGSPEDFIALYQVYEDFIKRSKMK